MKQLMIDDLQEGSRRAATLTIHRWPLTIGYWLLTIPLLVLLFHPAAHAKPSAIADPFGLAATFTVTTIADSGPGSLRQAILDANASAGPDTITFAIGAAGSQQTIQPASALPSITSPLFLDGWSQGGGSYSGPPLIALNGTLSGFASWGLRITAGGNTVRGVAINGFPSGTAVILLTAGGNWIYGTYLGVNLAGDTAVPNNIGIQISADSSNNIIGTNGDGAADALEGNLISGNGDYGILFAQAGTTGNVVAGNIVGADSSGMAAIPNGTNSLSRCGIYLGGSGNRIGTNSDGLSDTLERNLISGNNGCGILHNIQSNPAALPNVIAGNYVGTDATGLTALPNSGSGLASATGPNYNVVIRNNVISGNGGGGIAIGGLNQAVIGGNFIGVGADGATPLGNTGGSGISLTGSDNQVGGVNPGEANIVANHSLGASYASGIDLASTAQRNSVRGNRIFNNQNLGLDLNGDHIANSNDDGDGDAGANGLQNYPVIAFAQSFVNGTTVISGTLGSQASTTYTLDFYRSAVADDSGYGEGENYLGSDLVTTGAGGVVTFTITLPGVTVPGGEVVTATATDPDGSTSEFSAAFGPVSGVTDVPISGLSAQAQLPIFIDNPATFTAAVSSGTNVTYQWDFGDGGVGSGSFATHLFSAAGVYTATVSASNGSGSTVASMIVTVLEPANINGVVWYDKDEDGFFGLGDSSYLYPGGAVVTATLQNPLTVLTDVRDNQGNYQILTPLPGTYVVAVGRPLWHATSPNPMTLAISSDGGTTLNFGMNLTPPAGSARINGRAWADTNGNGFPDLSETPLPQRAVTVRNSGGIVATTVTDALGWINVPGLAPGSYSIDITAPAGFFPALQTRQVTVAAGQVANAHAPFLPGGSVGGQITDSSGAGVGGVTLTLLPDNLQTTAAADGSYSFSGLSAGERSLFLAPPADFITPDGVQERAVSVAFNSTALENWSLLRKGLLTVKAIQVSGSQALPVGGMFFELLQDGSVVGFATTDMSGEAVFGGLLPGTYVARPLAAAVLPGALVYPATRSAVVTTDSAATLNFSFALARSLSLYCVLPGTPPSGFGCLYEVRNSGSSLIDSGALPAANPAVTLWNLNPATLEVRLIPDPALADQASWPTYSTVVVLDDSTNAHVYYPYNPTNAQTISGYAFWDRCAPAGVRANTGTCNETGVGSNNGLTVTLQTAAGVPITGTLTTNGNGLNSGYFAFPNVGIGNYRLAIDLPVGYTPTTAASYGLALDGISTPEQFLFGYQLNQNRALAGRVFADLNSSGQYDAAWDDPLPGVPVTITTAAGQFVATRTTASDGSFTVDPISSGDYQVTIVSAGNTHVRLAGVPAAGSIPIVDFALPPSGSLPRVLVFVDSDRDGTADAGEQRLSGVSVSLLDRPCNQIGSPLETKPTLDDGTVIFAAPPARLAAPPINGDALCAAVTDGLPNSLLPTSAAGVTVPRTSGATALLPVQTAGAVVVSVFWDADGDLFRDDGEPGVGGGSVTLNGLVRTLPTNGPGQATFLLLPGSYPLQVAAPDGYLPAIATPLTVVLNPNASQTVDVPLRAQSTISGLITPPVGRYIGDVPVTLENMDTGQIWETFAISNYANNPWARHYVFHNLAGGTYRLRLPAPPPGLLAAGEPLITLPANGAHTENLILVPVGQVTGRVFVDLNGDGLRQSGESGTDYFDVQVIGSGGALLQTVTPEPDGSFIVGGLSANTPYSLRVVFPDSDWFTSVSPGIFTLGAQTLDVQLGVGYVIPSGTAQSGVVGRAVYVQDGVAIPLANARVVYESSSGAPLGEQVTGANGAFQFTTPLPGGRVRVVDVPGLENSAWVGWYAGDQYCGDCVLINGIYAVNVLDVVLQPSAARAPRVGTLNNVSWSAFRDDNGNGLRDGAEPGLPGVTLAAGGAAGQSNGGGLGLLALADGLQALSVAPPPGYLVSGLPRSISLQGADVILPPIALRPSGIAQITAFIDLDGDGRQGLAEPGLGGVAVALNGPASGGGTTSPDGRLQLAGLPDGIYVATLTLPAGFSAPLTATLTLADGGAIGVPVQPAGIVSALIYEDWDGDGLRAPDEIGLHAPFTVTLHSATESWSVASAAGQAWFLGVAPGSYTITSPQAGLASADLTVPAGGGAGTVLPTVPAGVVRGTAWLDGNGDSIRQPWETVLAGVSVTLAGETVVTDENGRYSFFGVGEGTYGLTAVLPDGLNTQIDPVVVRDGRGAVVRIAVSTAGEFRIYLPIISWGQTGSSTHFNGLKTQLDSDGFMIQGVQPTRRFGPGHRVPN